VINELRLVPASLHGVPTCLSRKTQSSYRVRRGQESNQRTLIWLLMVASLLLSHEVG
jgi:hypothetical protein